MKIAVITDDGKSISQHFGRAPYYLVVTLEDGQIVERELREILGHVQFAQEPHVETRSGQAHGFGEGAHERHLRMAAAIEDCEALLCGGMGSGAHQSMLARGIKPVVTELRDIEEAANAYAKGMIVDRVDRLH